MRTFQVPSIPKDQNLAIKQLWQAKLRLEEEVKQLRAICNIQGNLKSILENLTKEFKTIPGSSISETTSDPSEINHELLGGLLGGADSDHQHMTTAQIGALHAAVTVVDSASIDITIDGQCIGASVLPAGVDHNSLANLTTGDPHTQYTENSGSITQITTRNHDDLQNINGGADLQHMTAAQMAALHPRLHDILSSIDHTSSATPGKILKADTSGLPVDATNTDEQVAAAVTASHTAVTVVDTASINLTITGQCISADALPAGIDHSQLSSLDTALATHLSAVNHTDLTDGGLTTLHKHSSLAASDGSPDPAVSVDNGGNVGIGTASPDVKLHISDATTGSVIRLENRGTTIDNDDAIGAIEFETQDASTSAGGVRAKILGKASNSSGGIGRADLYLQLCPESSTTLATVMALKGDGKVGIGTTTPSVKLDVVGPNGTAATIQTLNASGAETNSIWSDSTGDGYIRQKNSAGTIKTVVQANGASYFNGGNVGINTTAPVEPLDVAGNVRIGIKTDATSKSPRITFEQYNSTAETEGFLAIYGYSPDASNNAINIGGGSSSHNCATAIRLYVAADTITRTGTAILSATITGVGVGVSSPSEKLDVTGDIKCSADMHLSGTGSIYFGDESTDGSGRLRYDNSTQTFYLEKRSSGTWVAA